MITSFVSSTAKKISSIDKDYLIVLLIFIIVLFSSKAFAVGVSAPSEVIVGDKTVFFVDITNNSASTQNLSVNFYAPIGVKVTSPTSIASNSIATAKIELTNKTFTDNTKQNAILEVTLGNSVERKEISLSFKKTNQGIGAGVGAFMTGFFSLSSSINELANFSPLEWVVFFILVIIVAVMLIAFISRVRNRV